MKKILKHLFTVFYNLIFLFSVGEYVYYCGFKKDDSESIKRRLVVEHKEKVKEILTDLHDMDGHKGTRCTQYKVGEKYYWPTITADIKDWVSRISERERESTLCLFKHKEKEKKLIVRRFMI
ncbi:hypothetical protein E2C01_088846 [Portunus trituberculatus]|uniref:Integrase zinc-binding domain-containing protein n=1 Tax=Portunus trituberculatus TaxID=210409 RepID=A0A5B7JHK4_PORTR|nr:hypothetical protein [Portunus trituberculatus]